MQLEAIERRHGVKLLLIPNPHMNTPHYDIERVKDGSEKHEVSHHLMETPEPETPVALKERPAIEQAAVTGVSPAAPAPMMTDDKTKVAVTATQEVKKPSLLGRLLNVLTGKSPDAEPEVVVKEPIAAPVTEDRPKREQNKRPRNRNNNRRNTRKPEDEESSDKAQSAPQTDAKEGVKEGDDQSQRGNNNSRRSRRGGRRRKPRQDGEVNANTAEDKGNIPDDKGNKLPPVKKEVDGNALAVDNTPLPNGNVNVIPEVKEVDGNKPPANDKPARKSPAPRRRRAPAKPRTEQTTTDVATTTTVEKKVVMADNEETKPKRAPRKVKPAEDVSE